jgi:hypothetical protein
MRVWSGFIRLRIENMWQALLNTIINLLLTRKEQNLLTG